MNHNIDILSDKTGQLGHLFNVRIKDGKVYCGVAAIRGGMMTLKLPHEGKIYVLAMPEEIMHSATWSMVMSQHDDIEFDLINIEH